MKAAFLRICIQHNKQICVRYPSGILHVIEFKTSEINFEQAKLNVRRHRLHSVT